MICILIKRVEGPEKTTLPSLWISLCEILRSGLSDVWAPCVAMLLCCLTPYLWPCEGRRPESDPAGGGFRSLPFLSHYIQMLIFRNISIQIQLNFIFPKGPALLLPLLYLSQFSQVFVFHCYSTTVHQIGYTQ